MKTFMTFLDQTFRHQMKNHVVMMKHNFPNYFEELYFVSVFTGRGLETNGFKIMSISPSIEWFPYRRHFILFCQIKLNLNELKASSVTFVFFWVTGLSINAFTFLTFSRIFILLEIYYIYIYIFLCFLMLLFRSLLFSHILSACITGCTPN